MKLNRLKAFIVLFLLSITIGIYSILYVDSFVPKHAEDHEELVSYFSISDRVIMPLPLEQSKETDEIALGKSLFNDHRISNNGLSCASCHDLAQAGINPNDEWNNNGSITYNTSEIYNTKYYSQLFWTGKTQSRKKQIEINFLNGMKITPIEVQQKIASIKSYIDAYEAIYPEGLTKENLFMPIIAYQNSLQSPSRFDRYLHGDTSAIDLLEKEGFILFKKYGCASCHQGINIGGNMRQKLGIYEDFFEIHGIFCLRFIGFMRFFGIYGLFWNNFVI